MTVEQEDDYNQDKFYISYEEQQEIDFIHSLAVLQRVEIARVSDTQKVLRLHLVSGTTITVPYTEG